MNLKKEAKSILINNFNNITFTKNIFIPVTNFCRNNCKYCKFTEQEKFLIKRQDFHDKIENYSSSDITEALFTFGERPEEINKFNEQLKKIGYNDFLGYLKDLLIDTIKEGFVPHTNPGIVHEDFVSTIKPYNASLGLMLESIAELEVHKRSPGKNPQKRLNFLKKLGKKKIPTTTGLLIGIGESENDRLKSLKKLKELDEKYDHIQEIIIQPCRGKDLPGLGAKNDDVIKTISKARIIFPEKNIQSPPNLFEDPLDLIEAGANDLGGISKITKDYINPNYSWPKVDLLKQKIERDTKFDLKERLPIYPEYIKKDWVPEQLVELIDNKTGERGFVDE